MSLAYTRAYLDRASASGDGPLRFIAATEGRKGDNIDLRMSGARLERYRANPVFLFGHRYFTRDDLPIGRGTRVAVEAERLLIDVEFDRDDEFAARVEQKYRGGWMSAVSIGFDVVSWEGGQGSYWSGGVAESWELVELSAVPVPMDASAVVESGRAASLARLLEAPGVLDTEVPVEVIADATAPAGECLSVRITRELARDADPLHLATAIARGLHRASTTTPVVPEAAPDPLPAPDPPVVVAPSAAQVLLAALTLTPEETPCV